MKTSIFFSKKSSIKLLLVTATIFCTSAGYAQIYKSAPYCTVSVARPDLANDVNRVKIGTLNYTITKKDSSYVYYNTVAAPDLKKGTVYPVTINHTQVDMESQLITVFIDYNRNNQFDTSEKVLNFTPLSLTTGKDLTGNVTIPATALTGVTRMRVIYMDVPFSGTPVADPCVNVDVYNMPITGTATSFYGGAWDFNVNIIAGGTGIEDLSDNNETVTAYPNPASEIISVSLKNKAAQGIVTLYDMTGKAIKVADLKNGEIKLIVSDIPNGIYFLKVNSVKEVFTNRVIVAH
jgi:trimeric autotransporter adhesin